VARRLPPRFGAVSLLRSARRSRGLDDRLGALGEATDLGAGVLDAEGLLSAKAVVARAGDRVGLGLEQTVVALAGATGSGKSSLFNALSGEQLSRVGVRRPTTSRTAASTWGADPHRLLDWLDVRQRHVQPAGTGDRLHGLVLLDLPDHDSTASEHRLEVDRLVALVDLLVWVLDPQKYADAAVHDRYLRPLAGHEGVLLVVLNQVDRLTGPDRDACLIDLRRVLVADGLPGAAVLPVSARTGEGVAALREELAERVGRREMALERLSADVDREAARLGVACAGAPAALPGAERARLVDALAAAAGVDTVVSAVAGSHRHRAAARAGWPPIRWLRRLRADPLRRLHLDQAAADGAVSRSSLPAPSAVERAKVATAVRAVTDRLSAGLPAPWAASVHETAAGVLPVLPDRLDAAVAGTDLGTGRTPLWWGLAGLLQALLLTAAIVGAGWLAALAGLAYLRLDEVATPYVGRVPLPTLLLLGGLAGGLLLAALARWLASVGARRRAARARRRLRAAVEATTEDTLLAPLGSATRRYAEFCTAVRRAAAR